MKLLTIALVGILVLAGLPDVASAQSAFQGPPGPSCQGEADYLTASAAVQQRGIPYFIEVELVLVNKSPGAVRVDPSQFTLIPGQGNPAPPLTLEQTLQAVRNPSQQFFGFLLFGVVGLIANVETQRRWAQEVEGRILRVGEIAPGAIMKGSVYYKVIPRLTQFALALDGMTAGEGQALAAVSLANCQMPARPGTPAPEPTPAPSVVAFALNARAAAGPVAVSVSRAELTKDATSVTVVIENAGDVEAELYTAIADATLTDNKGKSYAVRLLRTDLAEVVAPRGQIRGKLAFEPLPPPPAVASAVLKIPEIRVGEAVYEVKVELRF